MKKEVKKQVYWDSRKIKKLRAALKMTQSELAGEIGVRQQTVSEWEVGLYQPKGASAKMLAVVAERAGIAYNAESPE